MKKYYYIFSKVLLFISTIYLISGILDLTSISKKMIIYIFILNMTLELIRFIIFKENSNYEKKTIPSSIIYLNTIFFVLAIYFDVILLTSQTLPTQCHLTYKKSMALGYKLLAL